MLSFATQRSLLCESNRKFLASLQFPPGGESESINKFKKQGQNKIPGLCQRRFLPPQHLSLPSAAANFTMHFLFQKYHIFLSFVGHFESFFTPKIQAMQKHQFSYSAHMWVPKNTVKVRNSSVFLFCF